MEYAIIPIAWIRTGLALWEKCVNGGGVNSDQFHVCYWSVGEIAENGHPNLSFTPNFESADNLHYCLILKYYGNITDSLDLNQYLLVVIDFFFRASSGFRECTQLL